MQIVVPQGWVHRNIFLPPNAGFTVLFLEQFWGGSCLFVLGSRRATIVRIGLRESLMKRPSLRAILLGLIPFAATCFSVSFWDRVDPIVLGLPFNLFWLISWLLLTPLCLWVAYRWEEPTARNGRPGGED
jgi:Protein of unknown function (DUF3311)